MQIEYDPEKLIELVKKRPGIWDYNHVDYQTRMVRCKLWNDVVKELMNSDVKLTKLEMRELEIQLQKKWKSIKDCFNKYLSNPNRSRRPYIYSKKLQFLLKNQDLPKKQTENASSESDGETKRKKVWVPKRKVKVMKYEDHMSEEEVEEIANNETQEDERFDSNDDTEASTYKVECKTDRQLTGEFAFANVDAQKYDNDDSDKMFLMSLLPHLKTVREELKINVKMDLMRVLCNANYTGSSDSKII